MINKLYDIFNTVSITLWIVVIYAIKECWTFDARVHPSIVGVFAIIMTIGLGGLSLHLTKHLGRENLAKCIVVEQADSTFLSAYLGYFLVAFGVSNVYQLLVASFFISIFLYLAKWQYFNVTYLFFGYHFYHVTTDANVRIFLISREEIRSPENIEFENLRRINNTTYIERGE